MDSKCRCRKLVRVRRQIPGERENTKNRARAEVTEGSAKQRAPEKESRKRLARPEAALPEGGKDSSSSKGGESRLEAHKEGFQKKKGHS